MVCSTWPEKLLADLNMSLKCICQLIVKIRLNRLHFNSIGYYKNSQNERNLLQVIAVVFQKNFTVAFASVKSCLDRATQCFPNHGTDWDPGRGGGGVLPYMGYIGTCRGIGYGFWGSRSLNRVSFLTLLFLCPWCGP